MMPWLNYHHLYYFWHVAREGGLVPAGRVLRVSHSTLSAQIKVLEESLGEQLFIKQGRKLVLTEVGQVAFRYADEIFSLGREMLETVRGQPGAHLPKLRVGVVDVIPKFIVRQLLEPALRLPSAPRLICYEGSYEKLLSDLTTHYADIVIADTPVPPGSHVRAFSHLLGECGVGIFGVKRLAKRFRPDFPRSLSHAPMLLPFSELSLGRTLQQWFAHHHLRPRVVAEFADSALLKVFGGDGLGLFPAPLAVRSEVEKQYGVELVGVAGAIRERFYAISVERRLKNPAVVAISEAARRDLFGEQDRPAKSTTMR